MTTWTKRRSELALLKRHHPEDTEAIHRAQEALREAFEAHRVSEAVEQITRFSVLLTADQREKLVHVLEETR